MTLRALDQQPGLPILPQNTYSPFNPVYRNLLRQYLRGRINQGELEEILRDQQAAAAIDEPWAQLK